MIFMGVLLGLIIMAAVAFMALRKESSFSVRIASLAALGIMILTIIICTFLILTGVEEPVDESVLIVGAVQDASAKEKEGSGDMIIFILLLIVFLGFFAVIVFQTIKEHRKGETKKIINGLDF